MSTAAVPPISPLNAAALAADLKAVAQAEGPLAYLARVEALVPELQARVAALGTRMYSGCGFHYEKARKVAALPERIAELRAQAEAAAAGTTVASAAAGAGTDESAEARAERARVVTRRIGFEVGLAGLLEDIATAEVSANTHAERDAARRAAEQGPTWTVTPPAAPLAVDERAVRVVEAHDLLAYAAAAFGVPGMFINGAGDDTTIWVPDATADEAADPHEAATLRRILNTPIRSGATFTRAVDPHQIRLVLSALIAGDALPAGHYLVTHSY